ncbi:MAG: glucan 1,4-alpha-glucosidase [Planctomycetia bacterium]|nr:glucan 1,4-alpha-glucosidase [Planctomycetia bacterium]
MVILLDKNPATGAPGIPPRWARSNKQGVGTAYSDLSRVWFTVSGGALNEVAYPTIDRPQIRDMQFLITDGETFFHDSRRSLISTVEYIHQHTLGFRITSRDPQGRYQLVKQVISDPHRSSVLLNTRLEAQPELLQKLRLFVLLAPHLNVAGWGNNGNVVRTRAGDVLTAHKDHVWLALAASVPFRATSCGYVGMTDGWQDLAHDYRMDWHFDSAPDGNIALMGELDLSASREFLVVLSFGSTMHHALVSLSHSLAFSIDQHRARYIEQWARAAVHLRPDPARVTGDGGRLYCISHSLILAHEDKVHDGATIASLSTPWGEAKSDDDSGGYHLVWTRDMCNSATGLLAAGNQGPPLRSLLYLACTQCESGGFYQNFWIDGEPYWHGIQLDEVSFPIMLAWRMHKAEALAEFDPWPMVLAAASYLVQNGPATPQERWEENAGYSPSTLAANIAGLVCGACFARDRGHNDTAEFLETYADFLECHVERWTVTTAGELLPGVPRHYIRIRPIDLADPHADEDPNRGMLDIRNGPPGDAYSFPAKNVVDAGFLELVRYGIRAAGSTLMEDSLRVVDAVLKVDTLFGPCWRRYNHDGYGQRLDGGPFEGWGHGSAWPLLTGERGHYELAAGRDPTPYIRAMERFATDTALLPEQVWDQPDLPEAMMYFGRATGGVNPLVWAHAEYIRLVRSTADGRVFDLIPEVADRYLSGKPRGPVEVWKFNRRVRSVARGARLRILASAPFRLHWTADEWQHGHDTDSTSTELKQDYVDIAVAKDQRAPIRFTFYWPVAGRWEGTDFEVTVGDAT